MELFRPKAVSELLRPIIRGRTGEECQRLACPRGEPGERKELYAELVEGYSCRQSVRKDSASENLVCVNYYAQYRSAP